MNASFEDAHTIVVDPGATRTRIGHAGEPTPRVDIPSLLCDGVAVEYLDRITVEPQVRSLYDYDQVSSLQVMSQYDSNFAPNMDVEVLDGLLQFTNSRILNRDPKSQNIDSNLFIVEPTVNNLRNTQQMIMLGFEKFEYQNVYISKRCILDLFCVGHTSGTSIRLGSHGTTISSIIDGYALLNNLTYCRVGGDLLDRTFLKNIPVASSLIPSAENKLLDNGDRKTKAYWETCAVLADLKDHVFRVPPEDAVKMRSKHNYTYNARSSVYQLPDGTALEASNDMCSKIPTLIFDRSVWEDLPYKEEIPSVLQSYTGLGELCAQNILNADVDARRDLLTAITVYGGTSKIPGLCERLFKSLTSNSFINRIGKPKIAASTKPSNDKQHGAWKGGSIFASVSSFNHLWFTKEDYQEKGDNLAMMRGY